jgi:hypothetical protein
MPGFIRIEIFNHKGTKSTKVWRVSMDFSDLVTFVTWWFERPIQSCRNKVAELATFLISVAYVASC